MAPRTRLPPPPPRRRVEAHLASPAFRARAAQLAAAGGAGILVPAGGPRLLTNLLVLLRVRVYGCVAYAVAWTNSQVLVEGEASGMSGNWERTSRRLRL